MAEFLSCKQAAEASKCSIYRLREAIKSGELKAYRPGRSYVVAVDDLDRWVRGHKVKAQKATEKNGGAKVGEIESYFNICDPVQDYRKSVCWQIAEPGRTDAAAFSNIEKRQQLCLWI